MYYDIRYSLGLSSIKHLKAPTFPMDLYYIPFNREASKSYHGLRQIWKKLKKSSEFHEQLVYDGIKLWPLLKDHFSLLFIKQFPEAIRCIVTMEHMLVVEKPKVIIISDEVSFYGRAVVTANRNFRSKTIGIQHGVIDDNHTEYVHKGEGPILPCPIPDVTAVWGARVRRLLIESAPYSESNVIITGNPTYDYLAKADEIYSKEKVYQHFKIGNRKLVTVTTQPVHIISEREQWLKAVATSSKELDSVFFVVKPHPAENSSMHENICKQYGGANIVVCTDVITNELIFASDLMITSHSTTGLEAMILGTPLMTLNLTGMPDMLPYASSGAAVGVYREDDIVPEIKNMLEGKLPPTMQENVRKYIYEYAYQVDGKASERVVSLIENFLNPKSP